MTIWVLAVLLLASEVGSGLRQGAIRVAFSFVGIVDPLIETAKQRPRYSRWVARLPQRLDALLRGARKKLVPSAG